MWRGGSWRVWMVIFGHMHICRHGYEHLQTTHVHIHRCVYAVYTHTHDASTPLQREHVVVLLHCICHQTSRVHRDRSHCSTALLHSRSHNVLQ